MTPEEHRIVESFVREMERWLCGWCESSLRSASTDSCKRCRRRAERYERVLELLQEPTSEESFDRFWEAFPRKVGRRDAEKAWKQTSGERPPVREVVDTLRQLSSTPQWEDTRYIPYPATWLRRGGWADDPEALGMDSNGGPPPGPDPDEWMSAGNGYWRCRGCEDVMRQWQEHDCDNPTDSP